MKPLDLTLQISEKIPTFPGSPQPHFIEWAELKKDGYNLEMLFLSSHTGTHIDAPYHFIKKGKKIHQIPPRRFLRQAILIRTKSRQAYEISKSDITKYERKYGAIPSGATVLFATGWNDKLDRKDFFERNPGLGESAARYLASKKANLVGIDSPSIDVGTNSKFSAHHILLANDVLILENLCNLGKIRTPKFKLAAFPLKLNGATGSPVRAVAF
ncbi:MAG TPA: cyclase family protein [Candidatus Nitrosotenuis sp.]|nr:cyclase family protein [Candidatus Nitrosotenuis sp.]